MAKRVNPRKRPVTEADIKREVERIVADVTDSALLIVFQVLADKTELTPEDLYRIFQEVNKLSDEVAEGRVSLSDIRQVMREEYSIEFKRGAK